MARAISTTPFVSMSMSEYAALREHNTYAELVASHRAAPQAPDCDQAHIPCRDQLVCVPRGLTEADRRWLREQFALCEQ